MADAAGAHISSVLALLSVVQSFGLLEYFHRSLDLEGGTLQTAMFLQLLSAGHLVLLSTRSRKFFFMPSFPEGKFFSALIGTQLLAAAMPLFGLLVPAVSLGMIGLIWGYNIVWLFILDLFKIGLYRIFEQRETGQSRWQWLHRPLDAFRGLHH